MGCTDLQANAAVWYCVFNSGKLGHQAREIERVESISSTAWPRLWFPLMYRRMTKALRQKLGKGKLVTIRKKKLGGGWTVCAS